MLRRRPLRSAAALGADLLIHYGHSCLVPVDETVIPHRLVKTTLIGDLGTKNLVLAGTIQFGGAIRAAKAELEKLGIRVLVPQAKPLSAGEVLGCSITKSSFADDDCNLIQTVLIFVADGRFHLVAFMIANPEIKAFMYDPYLGCLFMEEYDHRWDEEVEDGCDFEGLGSQELGNCVGTLGRQGNPRILEMLEKKMEERGLDWGSSFSCQSYPLQRLLCLATP